ncbi:uncharacterized protein LOC117327796 [Pecten maximus]|uniref:uncharacterized protein LOC117327796 n=1 Tax=Pecten maximus TaxID=6579 RepID=UPI001458528A|nr:uncharacterized protein LOC117327796 [Pecten maximus]
MASCYIYLAVLTVLVDNGLASTRRPGATTLRPGATATPSPPCMVPSNNPTKEWLKEKFPNPRVNVTLCGRECMQSWVCDPSGILKPRDADVLDEKIDAIATNGICGCRKCVDGQDGYKIGVALVRKMAVHSFVLSQNVDKENMAIEFSAYLRSVSWKFGNCDNNIVIFYSQEDRKVMTSTSSRVESVLSVNCTGDIFNEAKPMFRDDRVFEALDHMVTRYGQVLRTGKCYPPAEHVELGVGMIILIVIICFFVVIMAIIGGVCGWRRSHGGYHRGRSNDPDKNREDKPETFTGGETGDGGGVAGGSF